MNTFTETRGSHESQRDFERRIGAACSGTGATPVYSGRTAEIHGEDAEKTYAKLKMAPRP